MHDDKPEMSQQDIPWERELLTKFIFTLHRDQVRDRRWRLFVRSFRAVGFALLMGVVFMMFLQGNALPWQSSQASKPHTAYINIQGEIKAGAPTDAAHIIPAVQAAFDNPKAKALILRINSPGGSPVQSGRIYDAIVAQRQSHPDKPVYAVIGDMGVSGAYYIAVAADEIYANRASMVGSIGVISSGFGFSEIMNKVGIERRVITSGAHKALLDPYKPLSDDMRSFWQGVLDGIHKQFIARVKTSRGDLLSTDNPELFSGLLWNGIQAEKLGLIDGLGSMFSVARDVIDEEHLVDYTPSKGLFGSLTSGVKTQASEFFNELSTITIR